MSTRNRWSAEWSTPVGRLTVLEPTPDEVSAVAAPLVAYYNEPHNRAMMAHETLMSPHEVVEHFARVEADHGRPLFSTSTAGSWGTPTCGTPTAARPSAPS
jgi:hypothetical protein